MPYKNLEPLSCYKKYVEAVIVANGTNYANYAMLGIKTL